MFVNQVCSVVVTSFFAFWGGRDEKELGECSRTREVEPMERERLEYLLKFNGSNGHSSGA